MKRVLLLGLIALFLPFFSAAEDVPDLGAVARAVYSKYDPATTHTGERGTVCNVESRLLTRPVAVKRWKGLGREQLVAAFSLWVEDPETNEPLEFAQACGRSPCDVALLERAGNDLRLVARGRVEAGCTALDLAPYRILPGELLIGARGEWMNHGNGDTTLTLLRAEGTALRAVLAIPVEREILDAEEKGVVTMVPQSDRPANVRIRFERRGDDGQKLPPRTEEYRWNGTSYVPVAPSARR
jgi:hypothetical protein